MAGKMQMHPVFRVTVPPGDYILGDPCYSVPADDWMPLLRSCDYFETPIGRAGEHEILAFGTRYGDGVYQASNGVALAVDSGLIGLVPVALLDGAEPPEHTCKVTLDRPTVCERRESGRLTFGVIKVRT